MKHQDKAIMSQKQHKLQKREVFTWSMAEGCLPWWKVETRIAKAWTWFMLTLNWSCNIRARSSHMFASVSSLLKMILLFKYQKSQKDPITPSKTNIIRSFFLHFPAPLGGLGDRSNCFFCSNTCCSWIIGCFSTEGCFIGLCLWFLSFKWKLDIFRHDITTARIHKHAITNPFKLREGSFPISLECKIFWWKPENKWINKIIHYSMLFQHFKVLKLTDRELEKNI